MKLNNSIKLAALNFALLWKICLYKIIAFGISILFFLPIGGVVVKSFTASGFLEGFKELFYASAFQNLSELLQRILNLFNEFFAGLGNLASTSVVALIYLVIFLVIIVPFLFKLSDVPASECVYGYMSSLNKTPFTVNFLSLLDKSLGYSILKAIMDIPFIAILVSGTYGILNLSTINEIWAIIVPILLFIFVVLCFALNITFFNGLVPSMIVFNTCATRAIPKGLKAVNRNFTSVMSSFIVVLIVMFALVYLFGIYAFIFIIPVLSLIMVVFGQVLFFESQGMDYYLNIDKIIKPRKLETADKIKRVKSII